MKRGCLFLLMFWVGMTFVYQHLLVGTPHEDKWWIWVLLGLSSTIVLAQVWSIFLSLRKLRASKGSSDTWREGQLVGISGTLQAIRAGGVSPISGKPAAIIEYAVKRRSSGENASELADYRGFYMTPCGIQSNRGVVRLQGFPLLIHFPETQYRDIKDFERFSEYLSTATLKESSPNPFKALGEFAAVLSDEDGDVRVDFVEKRATARPEIVREEIDSEGGLDVAQKKEKFVKALAELFSIEGYHLTEQIVSPGTIVTAFGTYRAQKRAVDIGSGFSNLSHTLEPGELGSVVKKAVMKSVIFAVIWCVVWVAGHAAVFKEVKQYVTDHIIAY